MSLTEVGMKFKGVILLLLCKPIQIFKGWDAIKDFCLEKLIAASPDFAFTMSNLVYLKMLYFGLQRISVRV